MIRHILLVAAREYRQIASTRSFWLTLLILPLAFAPGRSFRASSTSRDTETVMLIDQSGGRVARRDRPRLELDEQRR